LGILSLSITGVGFTILFIGNQYGVYAAMGGLALFVVTGCGDQFSSINFNPYKDKIMFWLLLLSLGLLVYGLFFGSGFVFLGIVLFTTLMLINQNRK
jgi:hypothetical protein